jgi:hypothetical protein
MASFLSPLSPAVAVRTIKIKDKLKKWAAKWVDIQKSLHRIKRNFFFHPEVA